MLPPAQFQALGEALHAEFPPRPPYDHDDITTWDAQQLDELAVWKAHAEGWELVDEPPTPAAPRHAVTAPGDHTVGVA